MKRKKAIAIQSWWRKVLAQNRYRKEVNKIILIQSLVRRLLAKRKMNMLKTIVKIQSIYKRNCQRKIFLESKAAVVGIQRLFRANQVSRGIRDTFLVKRNRAIAIQTWWRQVLAQRKFRKEVNQIVLTQITVRRFLARKRTRRELLARRNGAIIIQSWWRRIMEQRKSSQELSQIVLIQSLVRKFLANKRITRLKTIINLQRLYRSNCQRKSF